MLARTMGAELVSQETVDASRCMRKRPSQHVKCASLRLGYRTEEATVSIEEYCFIVHCGNQNASYHALDPLCLRCICNGITSSSHKML